MYIFVFINRKSSFLPFLLIVEIFNIFTSVKKWENFEKVSFCLFNQFVRFTLHLQNNHHVLNRYWGRSYKTILRLRIKITAKVSNHRVFGCGQFTFLSTDLGKPPCPEQTNILFLRDDKLLYFGAACADIVTCFICND